METKLKDIILNTVADDLRGTIMVVNELQELGYNKSFELFGLKLRCRENGKCYRQIDLLVDEIYSFDHPVNPETKFSIYALCHRYENVKGIFLAI